MSEFLTPAFGILDVPKETLPHPDEISYYILEKERKLYLDFDVGDDVMSYHRMILRWNIEDRGIPRNQRKPIWIYIQSPGGDLYCMWSLVDAMLLSETPVYTVNIGYCASAASLIYLAGEKRYMTPRAKLLIHEGSAALSGDATKLLDASDSYKKELKAMKDFILDRTNIPKTQLMKKRSNDWELDADYCLEHGVCHQIVTNIDEII